MRRLLLAECSGRLLQSHSMLAAAAAADVVGIGLQGLELVLGVARELQLLSHI